jgi:hypothetical protein
MLHLGQSVCFIVSFVDFIFLQTILVFFMFNYFLLYVFILFIRSHYYSPFLFFLNFFPFTRHSFTNLFFSNSFPFSFPFSFGHQLFPPFLPLHFIYSTVFSPFSLFSCIKEITTSSTIHSMLVLLCSFTLFFFLVSPFNYVLFRSTFLAPQDSLLLGTSSFFHCPVFVIFASFCW